MQDSRPHLDADERIDDIHPDMANRAWALRAYVTAPTLSECPDEDKRSPRTGHGVPEYSRASPMASRGLDGGTGVPRLRRTATISELSSLVFDSFPFSG